MLGGVIVKDFEKMQKYLVSDFIFSTWYICNYSF